jgi:hypothetical protein
MNKRLRLGVLTLLATCMLSASMLPHFYRTADSSLPPREYRDETVSNQLLDRPLLVPDRLLDLDYGLYDNGAPSR